MRTTETIAALDQIDAPAIQVAQGIYDVAPEREEVESQANRYYITPTISVTQIEMENTFAGDAGEVEKLEGGVQ